MGLLERVSHVFRDVLTFETLEVLSWIPVIDRCKSFFAAKSNMLQL
jgi:hypothetical protein